MGLEQNLDTERTDYDFTNQFWDREIAEKELFGKMREFEETLGLKRLFYKE